MRVRSPTLWLVCTVVLLGALALGAPAEGGSGDPRPLTAEVIKPPSPVLATDKRRHVVYEIVLQNVTESEVELERLKVIDARRGRVAASFSGAALLEIMITSEGSAPTVAPGAFGALFLDLAFSRGQRIPARLVHRFVLASSDNGERLLGARTRVLPREPARLGPPLRGGNLLDFNGCCAKSSHAREIQEVGGRLFISQRFAIDFVRFEGGSTFEGDPTENESYFIFGDKVIAAAPGRIVATRDGMPENTPPDFPPPALETAFGNYVTQSLGGGRFATYGHLHTGSVRVSVGQRVKRRQVLGLVGNTGNSSEPHLHFQVTDGPSGFGSNGVPFVFRRFQLEGLLVGLETGTPTIVPADPPRIRRNQLPLDGDIVGFRRPPRDDD